MKLKPLLGYNLASFVPLWEKRKRERERDGERRNHLRISVMYSLHLNIACVPKSMFVYYFFQM